MNAPNPESKTQQGLKLINDEGVSIYEAARRIGMNYAVLYRAAKKQEHGPYKVCPTCKRELHP